MKLTIDTNKKEIVVEESTNVSELMGFLLDNDKRYKDYTIVSKHTVSIQKELIPQKSRSWWEVPYTPPYRPTWHGDIIYCGDTNTPTIISGDAIKITTNTANPNNFVRKEPKNRPDNWTPDGISLSVPQMQSNETSFGNFSKKDL